MSAHVPVPGGLPLGLSSDRVTRGTPARWAETTGWVDRDGLPIPSPVMIVGTSPSCGDGKTTNPKTSPNTRFPILKNSTPRSRNRNGTSDWTAGRASRGRSLT